MNIKDISYIIRQAKKTVFVFRLNIFDFSYDDSYYCFFKEIKLFNITKEIKNDILIYNVVLMIYKVFIAILDNITNKIAINQNFCAIAVANKNLFKLTQEKDIYSTVL